MAYDPVLERDLFRPKSKGVAALPDSEESDSLKSRREQALAMIEAAKQKFDPENYQTLSEQERPQVFRPVAVNMPAQQQTADTAQRMQQMAAQGVRPVGMASGGDVRHFDDGGLNRITPTITSDQADRLAKEKADDALFNLRTLGAGVQPTDMLSDQEREDVRIARKGKVPYDPYQLEGGSPEGMTYNRADDPTTWTPDFRDAMINKIYKDRTAERNKIAPDFRSYVDEPTPEKIAKEVDAAAANIRMSRGQTSAKEDAARRSQAAPDKRDFAGERKYTEEGIASLANMEKGVAEGRDKTEAPLISDLENQKGIAALSDAEKTVAAGRDAAGTEAPLAVDQEAKGLAALRDSVRMGDQPGSTADASRVAAGIGSAEDKAATPADGGATPSTGGTAPATGGTAPAADAGIGSFKKQGEEIDTGAMTIEGIRADRKREREDNMNLALIQAGLSIMGGKSSNALQNIGEGARAGVAQFAAQESESKKLEREARRDLLEQQRAARQEKLTRDEMAMRERLSGAQIRATADLAAEERKSRRSMFDVTEQRLNTQMRMDWNKTDEAQRIAREQLQISRDLANNTISSGEADRKIKDSQFNASMAFDKWKVEQGLAAPSDTMKLYSAIGGGDLNKGLKIVQDASTLDSKVRAAQDVLNPMSGASEDDRASALAYLKSVIKVPGSYSTGAIDQNNPLLK